MVTTTSSRNIPPRQDNAIIQDIKRDFEFMVMTVNDLERHRDRILECIDQGYLIDVTFIYIFLIVLFVYNCNITFLFDVF